MRSSLGLVIAKRAGPAEVLDARRPLSSAAPPQPRLISAWTASDTFCSAAFGSLSSPFR